VLLPFEADLPGIGDSKGLSERKREQALDLIQSRALAVGVGSAEPEEIDRMNILRATHLAMARAVDATAARPDFILVDGRSVPTLRQRQQAIVKGDSLSISVGAASIVAKVTRDRLMGALDRVYPHYGFADHKGYPTTGHLAALQANGPCPAHRRSFQPVRELVSQSALTLEPIQRAFDPHQVHRLGETGETIAARHAESLGWRVLARQYRCPDGEIDLVAMHGQTLVFVEVKLSEAWRSPIDRVGDAKRDRLRRAAAAYLAGLGKEPAECRFDIFEVLRTRHGDYEVKVHRDAF
jgi:ribonuclease HII